jgi:hypothetical protein
LKRNQGAVWKALLGAFLLGGALGAFQTEFPWRGGGILTNIGMVVGYGFGLALIMAIVRSLTAIRMRAAALIWPSRIAR